MKVFEHFGCNTAGAAAAPVGGPNSSLFSASEFIAGIECEVEALTKKVQAIGFNCTNDGSLRNGVEYVSVPMPRKDLVKRFSDLHKTLVFKDDGEPFSVRTSTHVHVNVTTLDLQQARTMVLLYALFEECFFSMVKPDRRDNIHCVPLTETHMPSLYKKPLTQFVQAWHKYTALNLKRIHDLGTMEFRHLHGTGDAEELNQWLATLENLWNLCQKVEINAVTLSEKDVILSWFDAIFADAPKVLALRMSLFDIIRNNLIDVKFSV